MSGMRLWCLALAWLAAGCGDSDVVGDAGDAGGVSADVGGDASSAPAWHALVDHGDWAIPAPADDPLFDPDAEACPLGSWEPEETWLEVDTNVCAHLSLQQPSRVGVHAGDRVRVVLWHLDLFSPGGTSSARVVVMLGEDVLWSYETPIPAEPALFEPELVAPADAPAGTPITLRIDNHGTNSWRLLEVTVRRSGT